MELKLTRRSQGAFFRKLVISYVIAEHGPISINEITEKLGWSRRTVEENIKALPDVGIEVKRIGSKKTGGYNLFDWGPIKKDWISEKYDQLLELLKSEND